MTIKRTNKLFGSELRTKALCGIALIEETFPSELARLIDAKLFPVQRLLDSLEQEGIVVSRKLGVERRVTLNPIYFAVSELNALLVRLGEQDAALQKSLSERRARPRRRIKEL